MFKHIIKYSLIGLMALGDSLLSAAEKPNVIVIITDDQGYGDIQSHGNPVI